MTLCGAIPASTAGRVRLPGFELMIKPTVLRQNSTSFSAKQRRDEPRVSLLASLNAQPVLMKRGGYKD